MPDISSSPFWFAVPQIIAINFMLGVDNAVTRMAGLLMGSVATKVVKLSKVPVLLVK